MNPTNTNFQRIPLLVRIIIAIILGIGFGTFVPELIVRAFNTFNGIFDQLLKFLIPLIIVALVTSAIADIGKGAKRMLLFTVTMAYCATVIAGLFSYLCITAMFPSILQASGATALENEGMEFSAFFTIEIAPIMGVMPPP